MIQRGGMEPNNDLTGMRSRLGDGIHDQLLNST
jgi:hypothetical protein